MKDSAAQAYALARERYAALGVDTERALGALAHVPISLQCWQGDDVAGFETGRAALDGGLAVTGRHPGKARTPDELRADLEQALKLIPGRHRVNLHASYLDAPAHVERNELRPEHFRSWIDWAKSRGLGLDFNPTFFAHPKAADGFTLAHHDAGIRRFWIEHGIACRTIGAAFGRELGTPCVTNFWVPDGYKDTPADRLAPRQRLADSLDKVFAADLDPSHQLDAVESKLFGLGSESYVAGSHEFYMGFALSRKKLLCLDAGHFHPTETIADKLSALLLFLDALLLHVSRGVRWDSDHVVTLTDDLQSIAQELVRGAFLDRVHLGLDFFDASINRVAAWVIGTRSLQKALLLALLEPVEKLHSAEAANDFTARLAWQEAAKSMPFGVVWDEFCARGEVPGDTVWLAEIQGYEREVLAPRI